MAMCRRTHVVCAMVSCQQRAMVPSLRREGRTRTIEQMQELARSRGGQCLSTVYPGPPGKIEWQCGKGHVWHATVNCVWRGSWCPERAHASRRIVRTQGRRGKRVPILV